MALSDLIPLTKFDLIFHVVGNSETLTARSVAFDDCFSALDVRSWINKSQDFINIGDHIINKRTISHIHITEAKEV